MEADPPVTTLEGELSDQTALAGVLNTLYELHLTRTFGESAWKFKGFIVIGRIDDRESYISLL